MAVVIDSGPLNATQKLYEVPRERWLDLMRLRRDFMATRLSYDCRCLIEFVDDANAMFAELGFSNAEDMIRNGYELDPEEIAIAIDWLKLNEPQYPVPIDIPLGKREIGIPGGQAGPGRGNKTGDSSTRFKRRGSTSRDYILARLKRDGFTELAAKVSAGEMSANAAALEAGIRRKTVVTDPTEVKRILSKTKEDLELCLNDNTHKYNFYEVATAAIYSLTKALTYFRK